MSKDEKAKCDSYWDIKNRKENVLKNYKTIIIKIEHCC